MSGNFDWTDERVARLRAMWDGGLTASAIGEILGCNKNQVIGKAHRLGDLSRPNPVRRDPTKPPVADRTKLTRLGKPASAPKAVTQSAPARASMPAAVRKCQWPLWKAGERPRPPKFCNAPIRVAGSPYCDGHRAIAYEERRS